MMLVTGAVQIIITRSATDLYKGTVTVVKKKGVRLITKGKNCH